MKALRIAVALGLALGLSFASQAQAAAKKSVKSHSSKSYIEGTTQDGRTGMFFSQTADTSAVGHGKITAAVNYGASDGFSVVEIPLFGINYCVIKNLELGASLPFEIVSVDGGDSQSGLGSLTLGGKYVIPSQKVNFGVGLDIMTGPLSDELGQSSTDFSPKGMVTYTLPSGMVLNGELGFVITGDVTYTVPHFDPGTMTMTTREVSVNADDYIQLKGGVGIPFTPKLTGIAELGVNQFGDSGTAMGFGIRTGTKTKLQALLAIGLGDGAPDFTLGGAVAFPL
jgi:hypothetical protein